ncbi:Disease resistance protein CC-NBS-LRR class family [Prunus dulcis]|uniref:Disease resistance protein CC-NBS-LRR class family n=1 Tax=Prunus dulcis TaxID=3755 RepID=A0A4Y1RXZ6_PRUDU|nr:Disease resistance protein CC-NBS-LRR class family [Prunus dulcis]
MKCYFNRKSIVVSWEMFAKQILKAPVRRQFRLKEIELTSRLDHLKDVILKMMAENMLKKYEKYWGSYQKINMYLFVAKRYSHYYFSLLCGEDKASEVTSKVRSKLNELYDQYKLLYNENAAYKDETHNPSEMEIDSNEVDFATAFNIGFMKLVEKTDGEESKTEVDSGGTHLHSKLVTFFTKTDVLEVVMKWKKLHQERMYVGGWNRVGNRTNSTTSFTILVYRTESSLKLASMGDTKSLESNGTNGVETLGDDLVVPKVAK